MSEPVEDRQARCREPQDCAHRGSRCPRRGCTQRSSNAKRRGHRDAPHLEGLSAGSLREHRETGEKQERVVRDEAGRIAQQRRDAHYQERNVPTRCPFGRQQPEQTAQDQIELELDGKRSVNGIDPGAYDEATPSAMTTPTLARYGGSIRQMRLATNLT